MMNERNHKASKPCFTWDSRPVKPVHASDLVCREFSFATGDEKTLALNYVESGAVACRQVGDETFAVTAHNFFLFDEAVFTRFVCEGANLIELKLPRRAVLRDSESMAAASVVSKAIYGSALTVMLRGELEALHAVFDDLDETDRAASLMAVEAVAIAVVKDALSGLDAERSHDTLPRPKKSHREDFFTRARRCIESDLAEPDLNSVWLAHRLGCSRATLYRVFAERGLTVADYIRNKRLDRLRFLLETSSPCETIGELAASCGLYDSPNLSRSFRARYRMTPTEARGIVLQ